MQVKDVMSPGVECVSPDLTLREAAKKMKELDIGPLQARARFQACHHFIGMRRTLGQRQSVEICLERNPDFGGIGQIKFRRQNSNDRGASASEIERLTDKMRIASKATPPQTVSHQRDCGPARAVLPWRETAAKHWLDSQRS